MRILFVDNYYENVLDHLMARADAPSTNAPNVVKTKWLNQQCHGTADYWERAVQALGHEATTIITNTPWTTPCEIATPDVIVYQNISDRTWLSNFPSKKVAFCSYRAADKDLLGWDMVFTSFPHYVDRIHSLGGKAYYLPLAFDPVAVERTRESEPMVDGLMGPTHRAIMRDLPLTFVGGLGYGHIWGRGTKDLNDVAATWPDLFKWWGYGPITTEWLDRTYQGYAWGKDYYKVLLRSQVTINRHGEIAGEYANNMRLYEATGCGCCLVTNSASNMARIFRPMDECVTYRDRNELLDMLGILIRDQDMRKGIAAAGRRRCLGQHTYAHRAVEFMDVLAKL